MYISVSKAAARRGVTVRTVQRWIEAGKLAARTGTNGFMVLSDDVDAILVSRPRRDMSLEASETLLARLEELEKRVSNLEDQSHASVPVARQEASLSPVPPGSQDQDSPSGDLVLLGMFATVHQVNKRTALDQAKAGKYPCLIRPKPGRPKETETMIDSSQARQVLAFWSQTGHPWQRCTDPACVCQTM